MINQLIIHNFKSIREVDIELSSLNVLIGANGAGKSNFISFFEFLNNIYNQNLHIYVTEQGGSENILFFGSKESDSIYCKISFDNINFFEFKLLPTKSNNFYFNNETTGFNKNYRKKSKKQLWDFALKLGGDQESNLKNENSKSSEWFKIHFNSFKVFHFNDTSKTAKVKKNCNIDDNSYLREDASNLAAYLFLLKEKKPNNFKLIENTIKSVAPFFKEFDLKPLALNQSLIKLEWKEEGSDNYFDANNLSDGTLRFICLTTLLLQPNLPKTIIIDEPELGLHPFAINKLAGMIKSASVKSQIIISTQSVNLIDNFNVDDIIIVDRINKESTFQRLSKENLKGWLDDYTLGELWDKNIIGGRPQ
jgi:predicted ATPase